MTINKKWKNRTASILAALAVCGAAWTAEAAETVTAVGEYTMGDGETIAVAAQRAMYLAEQQAKRKAGVYVESYTKTQNMQVTEDEVAFVTGSITQATKQDEEWRLTDAQDFHVQVTATFSVDTDRVSAMLRQDNHQAAQMYKETEQKIEQNGRRNEELKQQIAQADAADAQRLQQEVQSGERQFLAERKLLEAISNITAGRLAQADADIKEILTLDPSNATAHLLQAISYGMRQQNDAAMGELNRVIEMDAGNATAYAARSMIWLQRGQAQQALADIQQAAKLDPNDETIYISLGNIYVSQNMPQQALAAYQRAIDLNPQFSAGGYNGRGAAYLVLENWQQAEADFRKSLSILPYNPAPYAGLGYIALHRSQYAQAVQFLSQALEIDSTQVDYFYWRGVAYANMGNYSQALADLNQAIAINSQAGNAYYWRGLVYQEMGRADLASSDFAMARSLGVQM